MSFGISAVAWGAIAVGTTAAIAVNSADTQRKAAHQQSDAINAAKAADALQVAQAGENANAAIVAGKRRRRAAGGLLATGNPDAAVPVLGSLGDGAAGGTKTLPKPPKTTLGA